MAERPVLAYWDVRGLCESIRMTLRWAEVDFEDKMYRFTEGTDLASITSQWRGNNNEEKNSHGLPFPNLPFFIDEDVKLTQSLAILNYVGEKYGAAGKTPVDRARCWQMQQVLMDLMNDSMAIIYGGSEAIWKNGRPAHVAKCVDWFKQFSDYLGDRQYICGDYVTSTDFFLQEVIQRTEIIEPGTAFVNANLKEYNARLLALPTLQPFYNSEAGKKRLGINAHPLAAFNDITSYTYADPKVVDAVPVVQAERVDHPSHDCVCD